MADLNINEVARLAGVSNATVSRYLNGGSVSQKTKEIIQKVIKETGFVPSNSARSMRTGKSNTIGVIVPRISSESVSRMVSGITEVLDAEGYDLFLGNTDRNVDKELQYLNSFEKKGVDGIILLGTILTMEHRKKLQELKIPVVILGQKVPSHNCVFFDDRTAAFEMANLLLSRPVKRMGFIGVCREDAAAGEDRYQGVMQALRQNHYAENELVYEETDFERQSGYEAMKSILNRAPEVDTIFCSTDTLAVGAYLYLRELGKKIPQEVRLSGIGHNSSADIIIPKLTTAEYYYRVSGEEAAKMLLRQMKEHDSFTRQTMLGYQVIERGSTQNL